MRKKVSKKTKEWNITIQATVTKTIRVTAKNEQEAIEDAHGVFSVLNDDNEEKYDQETISVEKVS